MVELFIANQQFKRDVIDDPKIKADIKVSDEYVIDTVAKEDKVPDEVDDEPDSDYISVADKADWLDPNEEDIEKLWGEYDPNEAGPICAPKQEEIDSDA